MRENYIIVALLLVSGIVTSLYFGFLELFYINQYLLIPKINYLVLSLILFYLFLRGTYSSDTIIARYLTAIFLVLISSAIFDVSSHVLLTQDQLIAKVLLVLSDVLQSLIPLMVVFLILSYQKSSLNLKDLICPLYIFIYHISLNLFDLLYESTDLNGMHFLVRIHPSVFNLVILTLAYLWTAFQILLPLYHAIKRGDMTDQNYYVSRTLTLSGIFLSLVIIPGTELVYSLASINFSQYLTTQLIMDNLQYLAFILILFPFVFQDGLSFNLISQSLQRCVVMNVGGLPIFSYDFQTRDFDVENSMMFSGSFQALFSFISNSFEATEVRSLDLSIGTLLLEFDETLTFMLLTKKETKIIRSSFKVFQNYFQKWHTNEKNEKFVRKRKTKDETLQKSFIHLFGLAEEEPFLTKDMMNLPTGYVHLFLATFFVITSMRLSIFTAVTSLLPGNLDALSNSSAILFFISIFSITYFFAIFVFDSKEIMPYLLIMMYPILGFLTGSLLLLSTLIFGITSWLFFFIMMRDEFSNITIEARFAIVSFAIIGDIGLRSIFLGTDLLIFSNHLSRIIQISLAIVLVYILKNSENNNKDWSVEDRLPVVLISLHLFIFLYFIRFLLNPGAILVFVGYSSIGTFYLVNVLQITSLFIAILIGYSYPSLIFSKPVKRVAIISVMIHITTTDLLPQLSTLTQPFILLIAIYLFITDFSNIDWIDGIHIVPQFIIYLLVIIINLALFFVTFYGSSNILLLFPLGIFIISKSEGTSILKTWAGNIRNTQKIILFIFLAIMTISPLMISSFVSRTTETSNLKEIGVMTYNIQNGVSSSYRYNPNDLAEYIIKSDVSIVALQEVTRASILNGNSDLYLQLQMLLEPAGFIDHVIMQVEPGIMTNVIFSKFPILTSDQNIFDKNEIFPKGFLTAQIKIDESIINIINTHLTHVYSTDGNNTRSDQISELLTSTDSNEKTILLGDFNIEPTSDQMTPVTSILTDTWNSTTDHGYTWPARMPHERIDYIFTSNITLNSVTVGSVFMSDHLPVIARLTIN